MARTRKYKNRRPRNTRRRRQHRMRGGAQKTVNIYIDGKQLEVNTLSELDEIHLHTFIDTILGLGVDLSVVVSGISYAVDDTSIPPNFIGRHDYTDSIHYTDEAKDQLNFEFANLAMNEDGSFKKVEIEVI